jgi:hypothetical protein
LLCLQSPQSEEEYLFVQKYGDSLWNAKNEVEKYFQGEKAAYYRACGEYQAVSLFALQQRKGQRLKAIPSCIARYTPV